MIILSTKLTKSTSSALNSCTASLRPFCAVPFPCRVHVESWTGISLLPLYAYEYWPQFSPVFLSLSSPHLLIRESDDKRIHV